MNKYIMIKKMLSNIRTISILLICLILLLFSPSNCNGVTYYRGIRGCSTDDNN